VLVECVYSVVLQYQVKNDCNFWCHAVRENEKRKAAA